MAGKQTRGLSKREDGRHIEEFQNARGSRMLFAFVIALVSLSAISLQRADQSANDAEIRIGNLMPYTGPLAEFSAIGKAEAAYFDHHRK